MNGYERIIRRMAELVLLAILVVGLILVWSADAHAYPASNDSQWQAWALKWQQTAKAQRAILVRHTDALGLPKPRKVPTVADWTVSFATPVDRDDPNSEVVVTEAMTWHGFGADCKRVAKAQRARTAVLHRRMTHPGGSGGERWKSLALYVGWSRAEWPTVIYIMAKRGGHGESGGNPRAYNPVIGCSGLMQIWPGHVSAANRARLFDPEYNLRVALRLKRSQGWSPWAY